MIYLVRGRRKSERLRVGLRAWLRQWRIEDVGGGYGFAGVRESDNWAEVCGSEVRWSRQTQIELKQWRKLIGAEVCGLACLSDCGWSSDWREREGGALCLSLVGEWSQLSLKSVCGERVRIIRHGNTGQNFLTRPEKYLTRTRFFWPEAKTGWPVTRPDFITGQPDPTRITRDPTR